MSYFLTRRVAKTEDEIDNLKASVSTTNAAVSIISGNINNLNTITGNIQSNVFLLQGNVIQLQTSTQNFSSNIQSLSSSMNTLNGNIISISNAVGILQLHNITSGGVNATANNWSSVSFFSNLTAGTYLFMVYGHIDYAIASTATFQVRIANISAGTSFTTHNLWGTLTAGQSRQPVSLSQVVEFTGTISAGPQVYHDGNGTVLFYLNTSYTRIK